MTRKLGYIVKYNNDERSTSSLELEGGESQAHQSAQNELFDFTTVTMFRIMDDMGLSLAKGQTK